jgi:hypothetical protein
MSTENTNEETQTPVVTPVATAKRGRGRPKGSKNKPKDPNAPAKVKKEKVVETPAPVGAAFIAPVAFVAADNEVVEAEPAAVEE